MVHRFREVPPFGRGTIRRFGNNVSAMKKLAGRDFEDILQVWLIFVPYYRNHLFINARKVRYSSNRRPSPLPTQQDRLRSPL